eukprot:jgi/Chrzof1/10632/Cz05g06020.t1
MLPLAMKAGAAALLLLCLYAGSLAPVKADFDDVPGRNSKDPLGVTAEPRLLPSMQFNDSWGPKLINTPEGNQYDPSKVDWSSVIEAVRVICRYEMRICNWCTRAAFHDSGSNTVSKARGRRWGIDNGGADGSLLLTLEQLRSENAYDSFSTFVAASIRKLVGFYNISYADGLAVCGAVAREMLTYGSSPVYNLMPAMDKSNRKTPVVDFRVGKLDSNVENPPGILPPADLKPEGFAAYFKPRFNRGMYDAVALMGSHTVLDNQGCVEAKNTAFPPGTKRMFAWQAHATYYNELATPKLTSSIIDNEFMSHPITVPPPKPPAGVEIEYLEQCKFTSAAFKKQVMISIEPQNVSVGIVPDLEPSFNWINPKADSANGIITPGVSHRTCNPKWRCYDGWPYTAADGWLGFAHQNPKHPNATNTWHEIRAAINTFRNNEKAWNAAYGNAFVRLLAQGATYTPYINRGKGLTISGWECKNWISRDGENDAANAWCQKNCKAPKGCLKYYMTEPRMCRCATAPWQGVATALWPKPTATTPNGGEVSGSGPGDMLGH